MRVRLRQIAVFFPGARAPLFRLPELTAESGERLLIHGPSGRGKTTLLSLIGGLMPPSEGDVFLDEQSLRFLSDADRAALRRRAIGIVFQRLNLLDHLTAVENASLAAPAGTTACAIEEALSSLGLGSRLHHLAATLSLGEQQRVAVARVLLQRPRLILADEPTSSLDQKNAAAVLDALLECPSRPTVVMVSHDERIRPRFTRDLAFTEVTTC